jgi:polygalacturonase
MSGGVENVFAHDCEFYGTDRVVRLKTGRGRGAYIKNCWFKDLKADTIEREAIRINMYYTDKSTEYKEVNSGTPKIENIHIENLSCNYARRDIITILGLPEMPVENIRMKNLDIGGRRGVTLFNAKDIEIENLRIRNEQGSAVSVSDCDGITINNLSIVDTDIEKTPVVYKNVSNSSLTNFNILPQNLIEVKGDSKDLKFDNQIPENRIKYISKDE